MKCEHTSLLPKVLQREADWWNEGMNLEFELVHMSTVHLWPMSCILLGSAVSYAYVFKSNKKDGNFWVRFSD